MWKLLRKLEAAAGEGSIEEKLHEPILEGNNPEDTEKSDILEDVHEVTKGNSTGQTKGCDSNEMAEELNIPETKIRMKRKMTNSPTSSEASKTLRRHPLVKKDSAKNKRHKKEPPGPSHNLPEPMQTTTFSETTRNKSSPQLIPSAPQPESSNIQPTTNRITSQSNPLSSLNCLQC